MKCNWVPEVERTSMLQHSSLKRSWHEPKALSSSAITGVADVHGGPRQHLNFSARIIRRVFDFVSCSLWRQAASAGRHRKTKMSGRGVSYNVKINLALGNRPRLSSATRIVSSSKFGPPNSPKGLTMQLPPRESRFLLFTKCGGVVFGKIAPPVELVAAEHEARPSVICCMVADQVVR